MKLPGILQEYLLNHRAEGGCLAIEFGPDLRITDTHGSAAHFGLHNLHTGQAVTTVHPALETEPFNEPFQLPFLNLNNNLVCDLHHVMDGDTHYLLLLDRTSQFDVVSRHQQHSHNVQLSNDHFKRLIEELTATQARLHKANEEKAMLIAMLSHEFGTPLSAISGYAELLDKNKVSVDKATAVIRRNAESLVAMIQNALQYGQLHARNTPADKKAFRLDSLLDDLHSTLLPLAKSKHLAFDIQRTEAPDSLPLDRHRLRQILVNLLSNAFKYTQRGRVQLIVDGSQKTNVTFRVRDTGEGVPADKIPRLFTPWVRGTQTQASGTGLGLVISKQLAESLGGTLRMTKTSKKGTEFQLDIPLSENPDRDASGLERLHGKHVLLVDDDPDILYLCQLLLEEQGLFVVTAASVADARELFSSRRFDLILTDINLADGHGEAILDRVRQHSQDLPVLAMSALPSPQTTQRLLQRGFSAVIPKPINAHSLLEELLKVLRPTA